MSDEREDIESRLRHELAELAGSAPARDDSGAARTAGCGRALPAGRGRALLAGAAIVVVIAVIAALLSARNNSSGPAVPSVKRVQFALAPITSQTKPPCASTAELYADGTCLASSAPVARNADVLAASVSYSQRTWIISLKLSRAALNRIAAAARTQSRLELARFAVIVDGRIVTVAFAPFSDTVQIALPNETRAAAIALATGITGRRPNAAAVGSLTINDHWHVALGVDDCGTWVPNWPWPPGNTTEGAPARAGSNGRDYAGLHSHGDGIIHLEPTDDSETGAHATLGLYFRYGGWKLSERSITFVGVDEKNGSQCDGKPGVLRWSVNGTERHGNPADYRLHDGDVVELVFTTAGAPMPPKTDVPSYRSLQDILGYVNP